METPSQQNAQGSREQEKTNYYSIWAIMLQHELRASKEKEYEIDVLKISKMASSIVYDVLDEPIKHN